MYLIPFEIVNEIFGMNRNEKKKLIPRDKISNSVSVKLVELFRGNKSKYFIRESTEDFQPKLTSFNPFAHLYVLIFKM